MNANFPLITLLLLSMICIIPSCSTGGYDHRLMQADSIMQNDSQGSLKLLQLINPIELSERNNAYYSLLKSEAQFLNNLKIKSDSLIKAAVDYYSQSDESEMKARSYIYAAAIEHRLGNAQEAVEFIQKAGDGAYDIADNRLLYSLYYCWGIIIQEEKPFSKSIKYLKAAEVVAERMSDTLRIICAKREMAFSFMLDSDYDNAEIQLKQAIVLAKLSVNQDIVTDINAYLAKIFEAKKDYRRALEFANKAQLVSVKRNIPSLYSLKCRIFLKLNQIDSALVCAKQCMSDTTLYGKAMAQEMLMQVEERRNNYKSALFHAKKYAELLDSIMTIQSNEKAMELQHQYEYNKIKSERDAFELKATWKSMLILMMTLVIFMVGIIGYNLSKKRKYKAEKLADKVEENANKYISEQAEELKLVKEQLFEEQLVVKKIRKFAAVKDADRIREKIRITKDELNELAESVDICYDRFTTRLKERFPRLKDRDIYMCCLLRIGVPNKDIAYILDMEDNTYRTYKKRLKSRIVPEQESHLHLTSFLETI